MKIQLLKVLVLCCTFLSFGTTAQHSFNPETPSPLTFPKPAIVPCGLHDDVLPDSVVQYMKMAPTWAKQRAARKAATDLYICRIAVDIDSDTYEQFNRDTTLIKYEVIKMIDQASRIFEKEINTKLVVSIVNIWKNPATDPYKNVSDIYALYNNLTSTWFTTNAQLKSLSSKYDKLMYINSKGFSGAGGLGSLGGKQSVVGWGGISTIAHELGHNFGSPHTQSCSWPGGVIDYCYASESDCYTGALDEQRGTLMSYCNIRLATFHPICQAVMLQHASTKLAKVSSATNIPSIQPVLNFDGQSVIIWNPDTNAEKYVVEFSDKSDFASVTTSDTSSINAYNFTKIARGKLYTRIKSINRVGVSSWSNVMSMVVPDTALLAPVLLSPANNSGNIAYSSALNLKFNPVASTSSYDIEVTSVSDIGFKSASTIRTSVTATSYSFTPSSNYGYIWRVRAVRGGIKGAWSDHFRFFTTTSYALTFPKGTNAAARTDLPLVFPIGYYGNTLTSKATVSLTISTKADFSNPVLVKSARTSDYTSYYYTFMTSNLQSNTFYYAKIEESYDTDNPVNNIPKGTIISSVITTFNTSSQTEYPQCKYFNNDINSLIHPTISSIRGGKNGVFLQTSGGIQKIHTDSLMVSDFGRSSTGGLFGNSLSSFGTSNDDSSIWAISPISLRKTFVGTFPVTEYALNTLSQSNGKQKVANQVLLPYLGDSLYRVASGFNVNSSTQLVFSSSSIYYLLKVSGGKVEILLPFGKNNYVYHTVANDKEAWFRVYNQVKSRYEIWRYSFQTGQKTIYSVDQVKEFGFYIGQMALDLAGNLWLYSFDWQYKLLKFDGTTWSNQTGSTMLYGPSLITTDSNGKVYLLDDFKVLQHNGTSIKTVIDNVPFTNLNSMIVDNRGKIWFDSKYHGLLRFDPCTSVITKPTLTSSKTVIDYGESVALQAQGCLNTLWSWSDKKGNLGELLTQTKGIREFLPTSNTTYIARCTNENNCLSEGVSIAINVLPTIYLTTDTKKICQGDTITLNPKFAGEFDAANKWSFYLKLGNSRTAITFNTDTKTFSIPVHSSTKEGQYYLKMEASHPAIQSKDSVLVNLQKSPSLTTKDFEICETQQLTLSVLSDAATYQWSNRAGSFTSNVKTPVINSISTNYTGNYSVIATGENGCKSTGSIIVKVNPTPKPIASISGAMYAGTEARFYATGASSYSWTGPNGFSSKDQSLTISRLSIANEGLYILKGTDLIGCTGETSVTLKLQLALGNETEENTNLLVFPNPTNDVLRIRTNLEGIATVKLIDALGREVLGHTFRKETAIYTSEYAKGVYFIEVEQQGFKEVRKVIIQ